MRLNLHFIVICSLLLFGISNIIFFFCFQHLIIDNTHMLLVTVVYTIFRDTLERQPLGFSVSLPHVYFVIDVPVYL